MIVFLWSAGPAAGVTDNWPTARRDAAECLRSRQADTAVIEQARFIPGTESLADGYLRDCGGPCWTGHRRPGGQVSWRLRARDPELAVS